MGTRETLLQRDIISCQAIYRFLNDQYILQHRRVEVILWPYYFRRINGGIQKATLDEKWVNYLRIFDELL